MQFKKCTQSLNLCEYNDMCCQHLYCGIIEFTKGSKDNPLFTGFELKQIIWNFYIYFLFHLFSIVNTFL